MVCSTRFSRKMRKRFACLAAFPVAPPRITQLLSTGPHVIQRFFRLLIGPLLLILACALPQAASAADGVEIKRAYVEATDEGYRLSANYGFDLSHGLEDTLQYGVVLYFTTSIEFTRPRDRKSVV